MEEIWKPIKGYEGLYQVSNLGRIKSLKRGKEKILSPGFDGKYLFVLLWRDAISTHHKVHRLVAEAFIPNPFNLPQVNHKDECGINNVLSNLEWCSGQYNIDYSQSIPINQYTKDYVFIKQWKSINEAGRQTSVAISSICKVCKGERKSAGGFIWRYA